MKRELFGVQLPDKVSAILAEVEQLFGNSVREEWLSPDHPMSGNSTVAEDGTPIIQINPGHGRTQDVILHELYHFKLRNSGYPVLLWLFPTEMNTDAHIAAFKQLSQQLYDRMALPVW